MDLGFDTKFFNPAATPDASVSIEQEPGTASGADARPSYLVTVPGRSGGPSYVYNRSIILAVNLALATRRPLFIAGSPGTGKSTLAANVAGVLGWKYYDKVVTSRTRARDLMWSFDALRRLNDASARTKDLAPRAAYVRPEVLWWAFDPASARWRGASDGERRAIEPADDPGVDATPRRTGLRTRTSARTPRPSSDARSAVVLLDEIDKADPDVPNDLLEVLDVGRFTVEDLDRPRPVRSSAERVLVMLTSNGERELPPAFLRRCVMLELQEPNAKWLLTIANDRFPAGDRALHEQLARHVIELRDAARSRDLRAPSTAEYLDAVRACADLGISVGSPEFSLVSGALLSKRERDAAAPAGQ